MGPIFGGRGYFIVPNSTSILTGSKLSLSLGCCLRTTASKVNRGQANRDKVTIYADPIKSRIMIP